ncbi:MAG: OmpA family protein [Gemmatimonadota bacterium]
MRHFALPSTGSLGARAGTLAALLAIHLAGTASAQRLNRLELGAAGSFQSYDSALELKSTIGGTFRLGYWIFGPISIEAQGGYARPHTNTALDAAVGVTAIGGWALYNAPIGRYSSAFAKLGYASLGFGTCPANSTPGSGPCGSAGGVQGGAGVRLAISPTLLVRLDGEYLRSQSSRKFSNLTGSLGVSLMIGSQPLVDTDGDHVYDRSDKCPNTPLGALVDKTGCPTDADSDGIPDGLDRCPNSPKGASVDAVGCTGDKDGDGVVDGLDRCPNTPRGAAVDGVGCPKDSDKDGVPDGLDRCPSTPPGAKVDALGCPGDEDNDGVFDGLDRCPNTPAGVQVNAFGCPPNQDSDKDGVIDAADKCPDTPAGTKVDASGCPVAAAPAQDQSNPPAPTDTTTHAQPSPSQPSSTATGKLTWVIPGPSFALQSARLLLSANAVLDSLAVQLISDPNTRAEISGYAQDRLIPADNQRLSRLRADAVRSYLVEKGVPATRLTTKGLGAQTLIVADTTATARAINRRVEVHILPQ